ncbi:MAG: DUF4747 family protein [Bradyrhizobium sp.]|uniref:DUF4747 family protein n=1 Tax=Bradyrhizobium sp. TaxID=376 RepID=UPI001221E7D5|nr:DUF4747 family protein [Bradyrhizobium sp.]THD68436.1 MAG: DUF4747 family protein [Bradyrhizobium sp.]
MAVQKIEVAALNIVASPHPKGVYREILSAIANKEVTLWGSDRGKITEFQEMEDKPNLLYGRVLVWGEIDKDGKWLNKNKNIEATPEEKQKIAKAIPEDYEPNFRSFYFVFIEDKHRLIFESKNELDQHFAPSRAERMFQRLFDRHLPDSASAVDVTAIPEDETLEAIFAIPKLRRLEIFVKRPNADDSADAEQRILNRMERQSAGGLKTELTKAPKKKSLTPDNGTKSMAAVAAAGNGHVTGEGKDAKGKKVFESTKEHPKIRPVEVEGASSFAAFLSALRFFS